MSDEMINKTKAYNKSTGLQGIGDTVTLMNEHDMNALNDPIAGSAGQKGKTNVGKYNKNS